MAMIVLEHGASITPTAKEVELAGYSSRSLAKRIGKKKETFKIRVEGEGRASEEIVVPASALRMFIQLLTEMAQGHSVTLMPTYAELTTQQAADLLNVSRPFLVKLLDEGKIPFRKVGKHRRIEAKALLFYKDKLQADQRTALENLTAEAEDLGLGY